MSKMKTYMVVVVVELRFLMTTSIFYLVYNLFFHLNRLKIFRTKFNGVHISTKGFIAIFLPRVKKPQANNSSFGAMFYV